MNALPKITDANVRAIAKKSPSLGAGCSRIVYDLGDAVLKVDKPSLPTGGCATEVRVWEQAGPELRELLCPIIAHGAGWVIMPKCEPISYRSDALEYEELREVLEYVHGITDMGTQNVMRIPGGRMVAVDYAYDPTEDHDADEWDDMSECDGPCCANGEPSVYTDRSGITDFNAALRG